MNARRAYTPGPHADVRWFLALMFVLFAAAVAVGCTVPVGPPAATPCIGCLIETTVPPPTTAAPEPVADSADVVAIVHELYLGTPYYSNVLNENVSYHLGDLDGTGPRAGWTAWNCVLWFCTFDVTVETLDVPVIAHEAGHVACMAREMDGSEACADRIAAEVMS